jgi:pteridine reductase
MHMELTADQNLKGRTILVTGGARRIGGAIVLDLAAAGADVVVHCHRSGAEARDTAQAARTAGVKAWVVCCDLSDPPSVERCMDEVLAVTNGRLDGIVNNASLYNPSHVLTVSPAELDASLRLHALAPLLLARRLAALGGCGDVVNVLDARITTYDTGHAAYHLSKRMLFALTRMLALELAPRIRVNAVAPGAVLQMDREDEAALIRLAAFNPLQKHGSPRGLASCVRFLLSCDFITGQTLYYDGGYHLKAATYG